MPALNRKFWLIGAGLAVVCGSVYLITERDNRASVPAATAPPAVRPPYLSSEDETRDAIAQFNRAGGFILPKQLHVVAGDELSIYFSGIVPVDDPEVFRFSAAGCPFAEVERRAIRVAPPIDAKGRHKLVVGARQLDGSPVSQAEVEIVVVPATAGKEASFQLLVIGDSLGHQCRFPNELARLLQRPGNPAITFVGTHRPTGAEVPHECYGGWTFKSFYTYFDLDPKVFYRDRSPFLFRGTGKDPVFDVSRYLDESLGGSRPRNVHVQLGTNDAFLLDPKHPQLEAELTAILSHADRLIGAVRKALPEAIITVGSVIQNNASDRAYVESYRPYPHLHAARRWRTVQLALANRMVRHFEGRKAERLFLVPTHLVVDPLDGYSPHVWVPEGVEYELSNAVHPTMRGSRQMAAAIYGTIKGELAGLAD